MAGGMHRRGERVPVHERIHGAPPSAEPEPSAALRRDGDPMAVRHYWVTDEHARLPGLLLEWRRTAARWQGRVVRPVLEEAGWVVVEEWLPADCLAPIDG